jgi:hypothetical protein
MVIPSINDTVNKMAILYVLGLFRYPYLNNYWSRFNLQGLSYLFLHKSSLNPPGGV